MHTAESRILKITVLLMTIGIQSSFGFAQTIEIHLIDDNTTIRKKKA